MKAEERLKEDEIITEIERAWLYNDLSINSSFNAMSVPNRKLRQLLDAYDRCKKLTEAMESISKNSCCDTCQEAKLVALKALENE